jgi:hypothetical protein
MTMKGVKDVFDEVSSPAKFLERCWYADLKFCSVGDRDGSCQGAYKRRAADREREKDSTTSSC